MFYTQKSQNRFTDPFIKTYKNSYILNTETNDTKDEIIKSNKQNNKTVKLVKQEYLKNRTVKSEPKKKHHRLVIHEHSINKIETENNNQSNINQKKQDITVDKMSEKRLNEEFISVLGEIFKIYNSKGEPFRARAYKKAQEEIMKMSVDITDVSQLSKIKGKGFGKTIIEYLTEYSRDGKVSLIEKEKKNPINIFTNVYGIGPKKAKELVKEDGITTIEQLRENQQLLNDKQVIGLKYYEEILERIPREEIDQYHKLLTSLFAEVKNPDSSFEIVGSYRRGHANSGDIDIIVSDPNDDHTVFEKFLDLLIEKKLIIEVLSRGKVKSLAISKIADKTARRIDVLYTTKREFAFAILYFTGSAMFNTVMRQRALDLGYTLNEHGLYHMTNGEKGDLVDLDFPDEKSIFDFLKMEFKTPVERRGGNDVIICDGVSDDISVPIKVNKLIIKSKLSDKPKKRTLKNRKLKIISKDAVLKNLAKKFIEEGINVLKQQTEETLGKLLLYANDQYYNKQPIFNDSEYDILKEFIERTYPENPFLNSIGASVTKSKAELPYFMASMDKIKPDTKALTNWMAKFNGPYILSGKLDGISALYTTEGEEPKLYTRGNGSVGQDVSHLIPFLRFPKRENLVIRGEIIITKTKFADKYSQEFANSRNFVSGTVNGKTIEKSKYFDLDFVAYELIKPELSPVDQFAFLGNEDIIVVRNELHETIANELLSDKLVDWRENYEYETDGVIVANNGIYERTDKNPKHAFAFKMVLSEQMVEAKILDVIWTPSKDGFLKPRIQIEPIIIGGAKIEYATAFNGAFVRDNKIGVGAVVQLVRSGDVIPHILSVVTPAAVTKMPSVEYMWNPTNVDLMLVDAELDRTVREKLIVRFFKGLEVESLAIGNVKKLMDAGFDTIGKIIRMEIPDYLTVEGFKDKKATKIYESIKRRISEVSLPKLMAVSNVMGRGIGERINTSIMNKCPTVLLSDESDAIKINNVGDVDGVAEKTAELFVSNIPKFLAFVKEIGLEEKLNYVVEKEEINEEHKDHPYYGKTVVFTGCRYKDSEGKFKLFNMKQGSSVSKKTDIVVAKDVDEESGKTLLAKKFEIPIVSLDEFSSNM